MNILDEIKEELTRLERVKTEALENGGHSDHKKLTGEHRKQWEAAECQIRELVPIRGVANKAALDFHNYQAFAKV